MRRFLLVLVLAAFTTLSTAAEAQAPGAAPEKRADTAKVAKKTKKPAKKATKSAPVKKSKTANAAKK